MYKHYLRLLQTQAKNLYDTPFHISLPFESRTPEDDNVKKVKPIGVPSAHLLLIQEHAGAGAHLTLDALTRLVVRYHRLLQLVLGLSTNQTPNQSPNQPTNEQNQISQANPPSLGHSPAR